MELAAAPVLVVSPRQTSGRGRTGHEWWTAPRGMYASLAFPHDALEVPGTFPLTAGMAARGAVGELASISLDLKWPNDLFAGELKVGGILVERDGGHVVAGCGLNLWWPDAPPGVGALFGRDPGDQIAVRLATRWADLLGEVRWDRAAYRAACRTLGHEVTWEPSGRGVAVDISSDGGLVVETAAGRTTLRSGEVRTVRRVEDS